VVPRKNENEVLSRYFQDLTVNRLCFDLVEFGIQIGRSGFGFETKKYDWQTQENIEKLS